MKKDKVKDPNKPKRPPGCFILFKEEFKKTFKKHPLLKIQNIECRVSVEAGERWKYRFLKFRGAIIKDYLASRTFQKELDAHLETYKKSEKYMKELDEHLERYKKSEKYKKELGEHVERYKKSEDNRKALAHQLELHKKSEKYKKKLGEVVERYKKSEDFQKALSQHLETYKKSEKYKQELADHLEKYKGSKEHKDIAVQEVVGSFLQSLPAAQGRVYDLLRNRFPDLDIASCGFPAKLETASTSSSLKDKVKDPNKPKRPPNSFFIFKEEFKKTYKKHPFLKIQNTAVCRISIDASEKWKCMLKSEKAPYIAKAEEMMAEYKEKMQAYNGGGVPESRKELDSHLEKYKGSEEHTMELDHHLERYKKSEYFQKALTQHWETYKKSEKYMKELCEILVSLNLQMLKCLENLKFYGKDENELKVPMSDKFAHRLRKLTFYKTYFKWDDMRILGSLEELEVLKLDENAFRGERWDLKSDVVFNQLQ
nr:HMG1/2-like protein [Ipomoea batatas]